ncbi:hypothetical protein SeMB42_g02349 [Synchytrium endobioticum]|uniref:Imidazole glycerol phosphate synthase hisHF n=1 Tax=Synchytrium endobioticum TaxID=286115 RepID=A0A507DEP6_9FUNG|nr:hypothetical protein SeLEV6574_g04324 [Synchytrium endobioticum]TPX50162.1 hypothetical protein SeMB42_g02349 [Synchytrium endobioticum]
MGNLYLLDYGAGNVRSLLNGVRSLGVEIRPIETASDFGKADRILFPGVGHFGAAMQRLHARGFVDPLKAYIASGRPFMGICVGLQCLCLGSDEAPDIPGLGLVPAKVSKFDDSTKSVPHMGWNSVDIIDQPADREDVYAALNNDGPDSSKYYFVHSYAVMSSSATKEWEFGTTTYGDQTFVSAMRKGNVFATQFHPEKSGFAGLKVVKSFLAGAAVPSSDTIPKSLHANGYYTITTTTPHTDRLTRRVVACLDVRANDSGDLVVTKGDKYDVRESSLSGIGDVRNVGLPVDLARRYFEEGADEITFLNITSFRSIPLRDAPMLDVLRRTSERVFVPLTIGGGIRDVTDPDGTVIPALQVAGEYFRSGADKVSIGSDAVYAAERYWQMGCKRDGTSAIEQIAQVYGNQAVVISVDPRRVYVNSPADEPNHDMIKTSFPGPNGEGYCWYQCTVKGGREGRDFDVLQLVVACEALGAGEILLNCMDKDGTNSGYDLELIASVRKAVHIPIIASSGAGRVEHFSEVFEKTNVEAALAAGIFHRSEVSISAVKEHLRSKGYQVRGMEQPL